MRTDDGDEVLTRVLRGVGEQDAEATPPAGLEDRVVVAAGEERRRVAGGAGTRILPTGWIRYAALLALMAAAFAGGRLTGSGAEPADTKGTAGQVGDRYMLLLYEGPGFEAPDPGHMQERIDEYVAWARDLRASGREISGEELALGGLRLQPPDGAGTLQVPESSTEQVMTGYFTIRAGSRAEALALARTAPHLRHGGMVEIRRIVDTGP